MKLLYCHVEFLDANGNKKRFRGLEQIDLNLSTSHVFSYDSCDSVLRKRLRDKPLPEHFWANGDNETNLYNINVVAGKNGSGKSTVINYVIDLLYYIYLDYDRQPTSIPESARFDVEQNYNLLVLEENGLLYVVELLPNGSTRQKLEECQVCESNEKKRNDETAHIIRGKKDIRKISKWFKKLFKDLKIIYMMNNPTQRDYERNLNRQDGGLRHYFVYDCSIGANLGGQISQFFPYEVYKQVRYLFDGNQTEIRKEIERRIRKAPKDRKEIEETNQQKPDELVMPRVLRIRPRINMLEDGLIQKLTPSYPTDTIRGFSDKEPDLNTVLGELCCRSFAENAARLFDLKTGQLFSTYRDESAISIAEEMLYETKVKHVSLLEEQKHCLHAVANTIGSISSRIIGRSLVVDCCAVLPDGHIISGSGDGTIRIWNADTGECLQALKGHTDLVTCFAVLRDGCIASGSEDRTIRIWNANTGECLRTIKGNSSPVTCLATLHDGRIVSGSGDRTIRIWDANTGDCLRALNEHADRVTSLVVLSDGRFVSGSDDGTIRIWDAQTDECLEQIKRFTHSVKCLAVLPGDRIVSGSDGGTIRIWNANTGKRLLTIKGHKLGSTCLAALPDGRIISGSGDKTIRIWDADTGDCLRVLTGHTRGITSLAMLHDGRIVSGSQDGTISVWDNITYECISILSTDEKHQLLNRLRRNCIAYLDFLAAEKNDDLFARFARVENENYCFELMLEADGEGNLNVDRLQRFMTNFIQKYRYTCEPVYTIDFDWGLSSGEENMLRLFSNLFHIFDRDYSSGKYGKCRIYNDERTNERQRRPHACTSAILFLDEADLTLHPEWQRRLIHVLTAALPLIYPKSCARDMQLILSTHSPLLLGDIPRENICYLGGGRSDGAGEASEETFGQNIHTLLKDSFFLDNGTVGEFASSKINDIATRLQEILQNEKNIAKEDNLNTKTYKRPSTEELLDMRKTIDLVASGILRVWLEERWQKVSAVLNKHMYSEEAEKLVEDGKKLSLEERRYILHKWLEEEKL